MRKKISKQYEGKRIVFSFLVCMIKWI